MSWWIATLLGVVQGITEFLPISSSAHLRIVPALLGQDDPGTSFTAVVQIGTIFSVLIFFRSDLYNLFTAFVKGIFNKNERQSEFKLALSLVFATIPIILFGLIFQDFIKTTARNLYLIALVMIIFSIIMYLVDRFKSENVEIQTLSRAKIIMIGFAQALALIPGFSRSGVTITAARYFKISRAQAARFSFLLSVPAIVLSGLYESRDIASNPEIGWGPTVIATLVAFVVGYASIAWLVKWLGNHSLVSFVVYRIVLALIIIGLLNGGIIPAL